VEATSALTGFLAGPLSWLNWKLEMLVFVEEIPEKGKNLQQTQQTYGTRLESNPGHIGER